MNLYSVSKEYFNRVYNWIKLQKTNLFLWSPIIMAFGMGLYFTVFNEPNIILLILSLVFGICGFSIFHKKSLIIILSCFAFGFGYAGIYSHLKNTQQISHDIHNLEIVGTVTKLEHAGDKLRIFLNTDKYGKIRVSSKDNPEINIGDTISGAGGLFRPSPAYMPQTFDFARWAYFNGITATGYINHPTVINTKTNKNFNHIRWKIHTESKSFLTDALILGYQKTLPPEHRDIWTQNGIAHIWSISGFHLTLLSGWFLALFYIIFRCIPKITKRVPARIPAAICAWVCLIGYVALSGSGIATLRSFVMATLVMVAFILGRNIISLRTVCMAFLVLILINPHYIMTAGFQLSFAAIFGLVWLWTDLKPTLPTNKALKYLYATILTALTATIFTTPFIIAHFNSIPLYGLIGNLVFLPIFSFVIMPLVFIGTICALVGINAPIEFTHQIYDKLLDFATSITKLPWSNISTGNLTNTALVLFILGFAFLIFIKNDDMFKHIVTRHINVAFAIVFCAMGIFTAAITPRPIFYITPDKNLIGYIQDGKLKFNKTKDSNNYFAFETWKKSNQEPTDTPNIKLNKTRGINEIKTPKWTLVYAQRFMPLSKNIISWCNNPDIKFIASYFDITSSKCKNKIISGCGVIYKSGKIKYINTNRLWHNPRP